MTMKRSATAITCNLAACGLHDGSRDFDHPTTWWHPASWGAPAPAPQQATSKAVAAPVDPEWWKLLGDPQLTALETQLLNSNLDVRVASIRLAEARAQLGVAKADEYPNLNANGSYLRQRLSKNGEISLLSSGGTADNGTGGAGGIPTAEATNGATQILQPFDLYQAGFDASWEVDLWGRVRRNVESVAAQGEATQEAARDTLVTASAELARDYVQLRGLQLKLEYTRENLESARQSLALTQQRAAGGVSTDLDVANALPPRWRSTKRRFRRWSSSRQRR